MTKRNINKKHILPIILFIVINIVLGLGAAKAHGLLAQVELGRDAKLTLSSVSRLDGLHVLGKEGLVRVGLRENAVVKNLVSKVVPKRSFDVLADHLL